MLKTIFQVLLQLTNLNQFGSRLTESKLKATYSYSQHNRFSVYTNNTKNHTVFP